ncbi:MAG: NAD-dependent epimerase/dehydratase family protein [Actinomycetota bacterium]|nr:NAD-dependent epimerase/dehydratase family protein [Actinomycetota bacterium]
MTTALVTGGAGFFGGVLTARLLEEGFTCVSVDLQPHEWAHRDLRAVQGDIRDVPLMESLFSAHRFDAVFHCAAMLAHAVEDRDLLWTSNVDGTRAVADLAARHRVPKLVFISSNCLWGAGFGRPVTEEDSPRPVEIYGRSKWEAEKVLARFADDVDTTVLRSPTIIDSGRLGLLAILFEFIREGRNVPVVGRGDNRYQFVYAPDLADACIRSLSHAGSAVYNAGSDGVQSLREVFEHVVREARTGARVRSLPKVPTLALMRLASALKLSPLGPYHYRMIAEDFIFDTTRIKRELGWQPTLTNEEMLYKAYEHYVANLDEIQRRTVASAHRRPAKMRAIRILKWLS